MFGFMEAAILEKYLRRGLSLDQIAQLTGRHPSTIGYWMKRHGLSAVHRTVTPARAASIGIRSLVSSAMGSPRGRSPPGLASVNPRYGTGYGSTVCGRIALAGRTPAACAASTPTAKS